MSKRPIREIVNAQKLRPTGKGNAVRERRARERFACRVSAVLAATGKEFPVECLEISEEGLRINSQRPFALKAGEQVAVRIRIGTLAFEDTFTVVRTSDCAHGSTCVHLHLESREPALVPV